MTGRMVPVGRLQVATPESMALAVRQPTEARDAVDERIRPVAVDIIASDPTVVEATRASVDAEIAERDLVNGSDPRLLELEAYAYDATVTVEDGSGNVYARGRRSDGVFEVFKLESRQLASAEREYDATVTIEDDAGNVYARGRRSDGKFEIFAPAFPAGSIDADAIANGAHQPGTPIARVSGASPNRVLTIDDPVTSRRTVISSGDPREPIATPAGEVLYTTDSGSVVLRRDGSMGPQVARQAIACYGDSLTASDWMRQALIPVLSPISSYNGGFAGQWTEEITARMGNLNTIAAAVTIPADTTAVTVAPRVDFFRRAGNPVWTMNVTLGGIAGALTRAAGSSGYTFARATAGDAVTVPAGAVIVLGQAVTTRDWEVILWTGRNDISYRATTGAQFDRWMTDAIAYLSPYVKRVLILGITTSTFETIGTTGHSRIVEENRRGAVKYGDKFIDVRRWMIDNATAIAARLSITLTAEDNALLAGDTIPRSFMLADDPDRLHFTRPVVEDMATNLIAPAMQAKGWH